MGENNQKQNDLFEMLEKTLPSFDSHENSKNHENFPDTHPDTHNDEHRFEFLVLDMFLDHFFP